MESVIRYVVKRKDGVIVDHHYKPVKDIRSAMRFNSVNDYNVVLNGYHKPSNPDDYYPQPIKITYEEVNEE